MADPENVADNTGGGDVVITDKELFDHAISDAPAQQPAAPSPAPSAEPAQQQPPQQPATPSQEGELPRDPQGRFAPKGQPPQTQPQAAPQEPQRQPDPSSSPQDHRVPLRELLEERERRQRIEAEAYQMRQAWAQLQQEQQRPQGPETIWDAPDEYIHQRVIAPLRQEMQMEMMRRTDLQSREFANEQFGEQAVNAALQDMMQVRQTPDGDHAFRQIMNAGHPYGALVKWHRKTRAQQAIGPDPNAWLQQKQQEWVKDPKAQQAVLQYLRQQQQASNRPPNVSLPPSLSSFPASSGRLEDQGDLSNESLYRFAIK